MDKDDLIIRNILRDAKKQMLSMRKWEKYGCKSEEEMKTFLATLTTEGCITKIEKPCNAARDGHGRALISWENDPEYFITRSGEEYLNTLENP